MKLKHFRIITREGSRYIMQQHGFFGWRDVRFVDMSRASMHGGIGSRLAAYDTAEEAVAAMNREFARRNHKYVPHLVVIADTSGTDYPGP
jgi:hypothetical protein